MKTHITHNQERAIYRAVELLRLAFDLDAQSVPVTWSIIGSAIASQLEAAFPKVDGSDLYYKLYDYLEENHWDVFASDIVERCRNEWLFDCERRGFREWCFVTYMTWEDTGRDRCLGAIRKVAQVFKKKNDR